MFHRWLARHPDWGPPGRLMRLCKELNVDLFDLGEPGKRLPTYNDYCDAVLGPLEAAWLEIEVVCGTGGEEQLVQDAGKAAARTLIPVDEAQQLLKSAWSSWRLDLQKPNTEW